MVSLLQGDRFTEELRIENESAYPMSVSFTAWNFAYDEDGQAHEVRERDAKRFRGAASWVADIEPLTIPPKTEATVPVRVEVPKSAGVGTHSAYLRITGRPLDTVDESQQSVARVRYQLNALLLVVVQTPSETERLSAGAKLVSFTGPRRFTADPEVPFVTRIENTGNVHLDLNGRIEIKDAGGRLVKTLPIEDRTLLPESTSKLEERWTGLPLIGKYTARMVGTCSITDVTQDFRSPAVEFWYVSRPLMYSVIAAIALLVIAVTLFRSRFRIALVARENSEAQSPTDA